MAALSQEYDTCSSLVTANAQAFADGNFQTAFHALMALIHLAHELKDCHVLSYAQRKAAEQAAWLETYAPQPVVSAGSPNPSYNALNFTGAEEVAAGLQRSLDKTLSPT